MYASVCLLGTKFSSIERRVTLSSAMCVLRTCFLKQAGWTNVLYYERYVCVRAACVCVHVCVCVYARACVWACACAVTGTFRFNHRRNWAFWPPVKGLIWLQLIFCEYVHMCQRVLCCGRLAGIFGLVQRKSHYATSSVWCLRCSALDKQARLQQWCDGVLRRHQEEMMQWLLPTCGDALARSRRCNSPRQTGGNASSDKVHFCAASNSRCLSPVTHHLTNSLTEIRQCGHNIAASVTCSCLWRSVTTCVAGHEGIISCASAVWCDSGALWWWGSRETQSQCSLQRLLFN